MSLEPPPFQEASRCDVCKCSFNTFRRRHHCRCCGRTLCAEHSSTQMALPQFGLQSLVRVCSDCYNDASRKKDDTQASLSTVNNVSDSISRLDIRAVAEPESKLPIKQLDVLECTCGMPLCICEAPAPAPVPIPARDVSGVTSSSTFQSNTKPKKSDSKPRSRGSASNSNLGPASNSSSNSLESNKLYEVNGEGLREAIKNGDTVAVRKLLSEGVDANYRDKQGLSLLHLAAVFNQSDIAFVLMDHGASITCKNSQGETPLDCAPITLQNKMKKKIEQGM
ncbi:vacuolar protein sorting-associated protein 27 isoform X1 [Daucus carota subsp. sativus]|uniref:vacuolar protein sorting-associated protein 27 isoform X1 n=1 Tax=Daucus carota subsp. sativus TaxID=79200 RepID=UPI0007EF1873|nr:PREDICTED: vacuolar protein sorting-associated protein 27-like isoform X1 [Daucus carota subsp. sativus]